MIKLREASRCCRAQCAHIDAAGLSALEGAMVWLCVWISNNVLVLAIRQPDRPFG